MRDFCKLTYTRMPCFDSRARTDDDLQDEPMLMATMQGRANQNIKQKRYGSRITWVEGAMAEVDRNSLAAGLGIVAV